MSEGKNVNDLKTFTNKQVLSLCGATAVAVFFLSGYLFTFDDNDKRLDAAEVLHKKDIETIEKYHDKDIETLKDEMKMMAKFFEDQFNTFKEDSKRRTNTIRDRTDGRLDKLELSNSDKK